MADPFVAEIRIFPFNFAPKGWAFCSGQTLTISSNTALFSLLGTNYGGDGKSNFALPNLDGCVPIHTTQYSSSPFGQYFLGESGGSPTVTLLASEMPAHSHDLRADIKVGDTSTFDPTGAYLGNSGSLQIYSNSTTPQTVSMNLGMASMTGNGQPHDNIMPSLVLNYCIALQGVYPPRT